MELFAWKTNTHNKVWKERDQCLLVIELGAGKIQRMLRRKSEQLAVTFAWEDFMKDTKDRRACALVRVHKEDYNPPHSQNLITPIEFISVPTDTDAFLKAI